MVLDPTSGALQANRTERPDSLNMANEPGRAREKRPETGQTSENNPAVVTTLSAAALETTRPVNEAQQTADENRADDVVEDQNKGESQASRHGNIRQAAGGSRESRIDVVV